MFTVGGSGGWGTFARLCRGPETGVQPKANNSHLIVRSQSKKFTDFIRFHVFVKVQIILKMGNIYLFYPQENLRVGSSDCLPWSFSSILRHNNFPTLYSEEHKEVSGKAIWAPRRVRIAKGFSNGFESKLRTTPHRKLPAGELDVVMRNISSQDKIRSSKEQGVKVEPGREHFPESP